MATKKLKMVEIYVGGVSDGQETGNVKNLAENPTGSGMFDAATTGGVTPGKFGMRLRKRYYMPEQVATINPEQIINGGYYSDNYKVGLCCNPLYPLNKLLSMGVTMFPSQVLTNDELVAAGPARGFNDIAEQNVINGVRGNVFWEKELEDVFKVIYPQITNDTRYGMVALNIETTMQWGPPMSAHPTYTDAEWYGVGENKSIFCEYDGVTRTLKQLWEALPNGQMWYAEEGQRYVNRWKLIQEIYREKRPGVKFSVGTSYRFGQPREGFATSTSLALPGSTVNIRQITGLTTDVITLHETGGTPHTYTLNGKTTYGGEDFHTDYDYPFNFSISSQDYNDIWVNRVLGTQNYPYIWSKIAPEHDGAWIKGRTQGLWYRMDNVAGLGRIPIVHQEELFYEANVAGLVNGVEKAARSPLLNLQGTVPRDDLPHNETPKLWLPPIRMYTRFCWHRFLNKDGGYFLFDADRRRVFNRPQDQHHWHTYDAIFQGRRDMQRIEHFLDNSTLVADPEVRLQGNSNWEIYNGSQAFDQTKPTYSLRYWTKGGVTQVEIAGSHKMAEGVSRTDRVRVPAGGLGGAEFDVTLTGAGFHLFSFTIPVGGFSGVIATGNVSFGNTAGYGGLASISGVIIPDPDPEEPDPDPEPDPEVPSTDQPRIELWRRIHGLNWLNPTEVANGRAEVSAGLTKGLTMFKMTIDPEGWLNPTSRAEIISMANLVKGVAGKRLGIHFQCSMYIANLATYPAMAFDMSKIEKFNANTSLSENPEVVVTPSLQYVKQWMNYKAGQPGHTWNNTNPIYNFMTLVVQDAANVLKPYTVSIGRTEAYELGMNTRVEDLTKGRVGGYEAMFKTGFKEWIYEKGGGDIAGVRSMVGVPGLIDADIVPPNPVHWDNGNGFWHSYNGNGKGAGWNKMAFWYYGEHMLTQFQRCFMEYARLGRAGQHVTVEAGSIDGVQSMMNRTTNWKKLSTGGNASQVNLITGANWKRGADLHGSFFFEFGADWDGSLKQRNPALAGYMQWSEHYGGPGTITNAQAAQKCIDYILMGGSVGFFGGIMSDFDEMFNIILAAVGPNGTLGYRLSKPIPNISRAPIVDYYPDRLRTQEGGGTTGLQGWQTPGTFFRINEGVYLA